MVGRVLHIEEEIHPVPMLHVVLYLRVCQNGVGGMEVKFNLHRKQNSLNYFFLIFFFSPYTLNLDFGILNVFLNSLVQRGIGVDHFLIASELESLITIRLLCTFLR